MASNPAPSDTTNPEPLADPIVDATMAEPPAPIAEPSERPSDPLTSRIFIGRGRRLFKLPSKDSGFYGSGTNAELGDDNSGRETTPGFQQDKWERGTLMPR